MPTPIEFVDTLLSLPLVNALSKLAVLSHLRFALRGGVLRNLLFAYSRDGYAGRSFYEFVDPFSDIDLVLDDLNDWPKLAQAITSSIPFAGFHRWEVTSIRSMKESSKTYATISVDRLLLWFDGLGEFDGNVHVDGLDIDVARVIDRPTLDIDLRNLEEIYQRGDVVNETLDVLRYGRYCAAFPLLEKSADPLELFQRSAFRSRVSTSALERGPLNLVDRRRLEMAILDLVFTASDWELASGFLEVARQELPPIWLETSTLLSSIFYSPALVFGDGVGIVIYRAEPESPPRVRLFYDRPAPRPGLQSMKSLTPWVRLSCSGYSPTDCCSYTDFQRGVATIAWRNKDSTSGFSELEETGFAAVAAVLPPKGEYQKELSESDTTFVSTPAYVRRGTSVVVRADHGFIGGFLNRNASFYLGLIPR